MDLDRLHEDVLTGLLSGDPAKAEATALRLYTEDAIFKHPSFIVGGRWRIARLWGWWARMNQHMAPSPGVAQLWMDPSAKPEAPSLVLDLTYEGMPFWTFGILRKKHMARIVVMLHLVRVDEQEGEEEKALAGGTERRRPLFKIRRQEDFIQGDTLVSALLPRPLAVPALMLFRWALWLWGWCIVHVFAPLIVEVRAFV